MAGSAADDFNRRIIEEFRANGGRVGDPLAGTPVLLLHHIGARSGIERVNPVVYRPHGAGRYVIVASNGGSRTHPAWYRNLKENPHVELQDGPVKLDYLAHEATGDEKAIWWQRAVATWPDYAGYQKRTKRQIPVFVLEPME